MQFLEDRVFTRRLRLRKIEEDDLPLIIEWSSSDKAYGEYLTPERLTAEQGLNNLKTGRFWNEQSRAYLIELLDDGTPIGTIHCWSLPENRKTVGMALKIAKPALRRQGYGTEAQKYLIMHLFERMGLEAVEMYTDIRNAAQQRCLQKLGFTLIDSLCYEDQHVWRTGNLYRLSLEEYRRLPLYQYFYE